MFFRKKETVESLTKKCNEHYKVFSLHIHQAHFKSYHLFKLDLKKDFEKIKYAIEATNEQSLKIKLLKHFESQLKFINKNPFISKQEDMNDFLDQNYPYETKINKIIQNNNNLSIEQNPKKHKVS